MDLYVFIQLIITAVAATTAMTLFSYTISESFRKLYKEPVLLTYILTQLKAELSSKVKTILAWLIHYSIGLIFVIIYHFLWIHTILQLTFFNGLLLGMVSGIVGIISWMILFKIADYKPAIDFKGYYIQLFFAHIIFGLTAALFYYLTLTIILIAKSNVTI